MIKIFIGEDHEIVRDGIVSLIKQIPDLEIVGEAGTGKEIIEKLPSDTDILLMDINMPVMDGIETTKYLCNRFDQLKVLALSMMDHETQISDMFCAGAKGYMLKNTGKDELIYAIKRIYNGGIYVSPEIMVKLLDKILAMPKDLSNIPKIPLSKRELEVLNLLADGLTNNEIADKLFTSRRTIETHRKNLIEKTGSKNTASLIRYALTRGILKS